MSQFYLYSNTTHHGRLASNILDATRIQDVRTILPAGQTERVTIETSWPFDFIKKEKGGGTLSPSLHSLNLRC